MHEVNLEKFNLRTDLIIEENIQELSTKSYNENDINVDSIILNKDYYNKKKGKYITISFKDVTDSNNYRNVVKILIKELKNMLKYLKIKDSDSGLIIGLGNRNIISDALGYNVLKNIIVTRHLYLLNNYDERYRNVSILEPNVIGNTGIESFDVIRSIINTIKPDFIICIDSLCANNIERINKTIQITSSGITPGSGIGNTKTELSFDTLGVKTIAIGIPTVVDSIVIVSDTINYLLKKISYLKNNNNVLDKLKPINKINYLNNKEELSKDEKKELLGILGNLDELDLKKLIWEVLSPINANMIVTTKEIDFIIDKLSKLIAEALNKSLHKI